MMLCQNCVKAFNNGKYCFYCYTTYKDNTSNEGNDGKDWVQCDADNCISWHHIHCEEKKGNYSNLTLSLKDSNFKYYCPACKPNNTNNPLVAKVKKITTSETFIKKKRAASKTNSLQNGKK